LETSRGIFSITYIDSAIQKILTDVFISSRIGQFPFFKLPLEIRRKIFGLLVNSFYSDYHYGRESWAKFPQIRLFIDEFNAHDPVHPLRKQSYKIESKPSKKPQEDGKYHYRVFKDRSTVKFVRDLSHISAQFLQRAR
jgi:hypothetical protein